MALTASQLSKLRKAPIGSAGNRLATAIELAETTQMAVGDAIDEANTYVSDVARGRYNTITVAKAYKFAQHFGCAIEDLFPARTRASA